MNLSEDEIAAVRHNAEEALRGTVVNDALLSLLDRLCADIERNLTVHDPEQLRNSDALRESVASEADAILKRMQGAFA